MNGLFGLELPTSVNFVIAFVVVLALIGAATWLVRRFGAPRLDAGARNRQPRLAVIDTAAVDGRRKLVIIRRDNVEHLLMVGGPTDVVVETNIVRSAAAVSPRGARRSRQRRDAAARHAAARHDALAVAARARGCRRAGAAGTGARGTRAAARPRSCPTPAVRVQRDAPTIVAADQSQPAAPVRAVQQAPARAPRSGSARLRLRRSRRWCRSIRTPPPPTTRTSPTWRISLKPRCGARLRRRRTRRSRSNRSASSRCCVRFPKRGGGRRARGGASETARAQHRARNGEPAGPSREKLTSTSLAACVRLATAAAIALLAVPAHAQDISTTSARAVA